MPGTLLQNLMGNNGQSSVWQRVTSLGCPAMHQSTQYRRTAHKGLIVIKHVSFQSCDELGALAGKFIHCPAFLINCLPSVRIIFAMIFLQSRVNARFARLGIYQCLNSL
jgi:hypothetical protein